MKKPDWDSMTREDAIKLLKSVRDSLIGCEDAGDTVMGISEKLSVDQDPDAENEWS